MRTLGLILCAGMFAVPSAAKLKVGIDVDIANDDIKSSAAWTKGAQLLDGLKLPANILNLFCKRGFGGKCYSLSVGFLFQETGKSAPE